VNTLTPETATAVDASPLEGFASCHVGILRRLQALDQLPALIEPAAQARQIAAQSLAFFREAIFEHHLDEERDLFPAVLASAQAGEERAHVQAMVDRLTQEHRVIEALWRGLEKDLKRVAKGHDASLELDEVHTLVSSYRAHAAFEEAEFLPLSQTILGRNSNHMAALGLSLHMRHAPPVNAYI